MPQATRIPLSPAERKHRMPYGAVREIAKQLGVSEQLVSMVLADESRAKTEEGRKRRRRIQVAIARKLGMRVDDVFPPDITNTHTASTEPIAVPA